VGLLARSDQAGELSRQRCFDREGNGQWLSQFFMSGGKTKFNIEIRLTPHRCSAAGAYFRPSSFTA
jgi:hypothetical protein